MVDNPPREEQIFRVDWHTLNLKRPEISETLSTMPSDARDCGAAVSCRNRVYVLGGRCSESSSYVVPAGNPAAVATGTKIYVFGSVSATAGHFAEVFDTEGICWETVPPPPAAPGLVPSSASDPVLLDSPRSRILVHFHSNGSLHAFYPDDGSWECLEPEFGRWSPASAMVDDVVYFLYTSEAANKVHGNVCLESVVGTQSLDRKLHAFDVLFEYGGAKWNCYRTIAEKDSDKDGWDNIEPLKQTKPSPALANIQAAQKRPMSQPVSQPKPQATSLRPKSTVKVAKVEDDDLWSSIAAPPPPKVPSNPSKIKTSGAVEDDDPWAAIAAPTPTTKAKPLSAGRGGGTKPALKLRDH
ncbi:hypothetical protein V6N12_032123 [Hibiscus sabdariffa]|uniref:Uncharacterized protein n=1 Tax=Hibiscus sabdariffa TaxID=183260 RepID=A0ABR2CDP2_9ROSI